jgi:hypothetical protein
MVSENGRQTSIYGHVNGKNDDITNGWNGIASFPGNHFFQTSEKLSRC